MSILGKLIQFITVLIFLLLTVYSSLATLAFRAASSVGLLPLKSAKWLPVQLYHLGGKTTVHCVATNRVDSVGRNKLNEASEQDASIERFLGRGTGERRDAR